MMEESVIIERERKLRDWFTEDCDPTTKIIDGLDIGWGGTQRWATANMSISPAGPHLDFCCGYGTFLAQLGWRFPDKELLGLNIDFTGPHGMIRSLLVEAGVMASLVQADARDIPFAGGVFSSVSCFLGLQDIRIGFGDSGIYEALREATRVLRRDGVLVLLDEFPFEEFDTFLQGMSLRVMKRCERDLDVRWDRVTAEKAITLYARGYVKQKRTIDEEERVRIYDEVYTGMKGEMEKQLLDSGYYVPFNSVRMVICKKTVRA
ncbi:MAG: class I SAM-dependent methyltransferase [candidate division WOR-3 bacterium]|nr:MAG: class I SAM-dependent methyltransferase [candidate division WOR-3 bacterium]